MAEWDFNERDRFEVRAFVIAESTRYRDDHILDLVGVAGPTLRVQNIPGELGGYVLYVRIKVPNRVLEAPFKLAIRALDADGREVVGPLEELVTMHRPSGLELLGEVLHERTMPLTTFRIAQPFVYFDLEIDGQLLATLRIGCVAA